MRTQEDLIVAYVTLSAKISLDRERIIEDPAWATIADRVDLNNPEQLEQALQTYLASYIHRQQLFGPQIFMPATNGPADIRVTTIKMEDDSCPQ